jgi:hypothetical protein
MAWRKSTCKECGAAVYVSMAGRANARDAEATVYVSMWEEVECKQKGVQEAAVFVSMADREQNTRVWRQQSM